MVGWDSRSNEGTDSNYHRFVDCGVWGVKQILLMLAVVMGQSILAADKKPLIADPIVEKAIRSKYNLNKPTGKLTKADLAEVTALNLSFTKITDAGPSQPKK